MDGDMWAARLLSKRQLAVHSLLADQQHLSVDDGDGEDELRPELPCPYCFEALDLLSLFAHLEEEHFSETRLVLCPVCAAKVGKDMIGHFTLHHDNLLKMQRRRKLRRAGLTSSHSGFSFGKEINQAHLQALLGACSPVRATAGSGGIPDILLSTLVCNIPMSDCDDSSKLINLESSLGGASSKAPVAPRSSSPESKLTAEKREQKLEEATVRSKFVRQLMVSTLWPES